MLRELLKQAVRTTLRRWLEEPAPEGQGEEDEEDEEDETPFWVFMVPVPPQEGETLEQVFDRAAKIPGIVGIRRTQACQCGLPYIQVAFPAHVTPEEAALVAGNPKLLPGDVLLELWSPALQRHYDFEGVQDFWADHSQIPHKGLVLLPVASRKPGGSDGGTSQPN